MRGLKRVLSAHIVAASVASLAAILLIFGTVLYQGRLDAARTARTEALNLGLALNRDFGLKFETLDLSLRDAQDGAGSPAVMALPPPLRQRALFDRAATAEGVGAMLVLDAEGSIVADSTASVPHVVNFADRDFFTAHAGRSDVGLYISRAFVSPLDNEWSLALSRRVTRPDGGFGGVVVGTLRLSFVRELLSRVDLGPQGIVSLVREDGALLMRHPFLPEKLGTVVVNHALVLRTASPEGGSFETDSQIDGRHRRIYFRRVGDLPLFQYLGRDVADTYAAWWRRAVPTCVGLALICAAMLGLTAHLQTELRRRTEAEAILALLATTDPLTGLANRRRFDDALADQWWRAVGTRRPLALLMVDADLFKPFNDRYGHQAGDEALVGLAAQLRCVATRPGDLAVRLGGEEFALLLPETDADGALAIAETLRGLVATLGLPHAASPTGRLTVSVGASVLVPTPAMDRADLMRTADAALYDAKARGRDRASLFRGDRRAAA